MIDEKQLRLQDFRRLEGLGAYRPAAVLEVTGEDALTFLQGQFTQELRPDRSPAVSYGLWLNQKGRVLGDSTVLRLGPQHLWIVSLGSPAAVVRERLEAYLIADDVVIEDRTELWSGYLLAGERARQWAAQEGLAPLEPGAVGAAGGQLWFRGRRGLIDTLEWLGPNLPVVPLGLPVLTTQEVERARIAAGLPMVPRDLGPLDLPQEAGLEEHAISFTKGCYLGQEVMARLQAMGRVRRRLLRVAAPHGSVPSVGARLHQREREVGELRSVVADRSGGWLGLAMLTLMHLDPAEPLTVGGSSDIRLLDNFS